MHLPKQFLQPQKQGRIILFTSRAFLYLFVFKIAPIIQSEGEELQWLNSTMPREGVGICTIVLHSNKQLYYYPTFLIYYAQCYR